MDEEEYTPLTGVLANTYQVTEYYVYLTGVIGTPDMYMDIFSILTSAGENDVVKFYLNSPGGNLATATMIIDHIRECQAHCIGFIGVECASAMSAIALAMDEIVVTDLSTMMVHSFSYSVGGSAGNVHNHADFHLQYNERWIRTTYQYFLTEEEIQRVLVGGELFFNADSIVERWNNREECLLKSEEDSEALTETQMIFYNVMQKLEDSPEELTKLAKKLKVIDSKGNIIVDS